MFGILKCFIFNVSFKNTLNSMLLLKHRLDMLQQKKLLNQEVGDLGSNLALPQTNNVILRKMPTFSEPWLSNV